MTPAAEGGNRDRGRCCISECSRFGAGWGRGNLFSTIFRMPIAIGFRGAIVINMNSATQNGNPSKEKKMTQASKFFPIKRGDGKITGYIEMFQASGTWVTVPGVSRFKDANGNITA